MIYYWIVFSIPAIFSLVRIDSYKNLSKFLWSIFTILLIVFLGFRFEVGGDWGVYRLNFFETAKKFDFYDYDIRSDYLFELLSWIIHFFGFNFITLNLICSAIFIYAIASFCIVLHCCVLGYTILYHILHYYFYITLYLIFYFSVIIISNFNSYTKIFFRRNSYIFNVCDNQ